MTHASVFSGIGGPEVAATMLGWKNLFHCEINPFGRKVLDYWYPNSKSYEDITTTDFTEWRGRVNVLTGGFPCQPFSYAGQRRGAEDDRYLWPYMFRCIDQVQSDWVIAENVVGILTMVEQGTVSEMGGSADLFGEADNLRRYQLRETFALQRICNDLENHGYEVQPILIPACAVGAPHRRDRVFIVGCRRRSTENAFSFRRKELGEFTIHGWRDFSARSDSTTQCERMEKDSSDTILEDTMHGRQLHRQHENQGSERNVGNVGARDSERICGETSGIASPDTACCGQSASEQQSECTGKTIQRESGVEPFNGTERPCTTSVIANTDIHRGSEKPTTANGRDGLRGCERYTFDEGSTTTTGCGRWANFPSVSPVHRGNDGLPFSLDDLTISAGKWRTEALKAYGNAIVPQVMYEIMRAIELTYEQQD